MLSRTTNQKVVEQDVAPLPMFLHVQTDHPGFKLRVLGLENPPTVDIEGQPPPQAIGPQVVCGGATTDDVAWASSVEQGPFIVLQLPDLSVAVSIDSQCV